MSERDEIFGPPPDNAYMYCIHCERTYKPGLYRVIANDGDYLEMCPYEDCDGDAVFDATDWGSVREWHKDDKNYPEIPEHGKVYPLNK